PEILAKLDYAGDVDAAFLRHFLPDDKITGRGKATGSLQFEGDSFSTEGNLAMDRAEFDGWSATAVRTKYTYSYPEKQLTLKQSTAKILGGGAGGTITVASLP